METFSNKEGPYSFHQLKIFSIYLCVLPVVNAVKNTIYITRLWVQH